MSDVATLREQMIPPSPPPTRETGAVKWLRENLFSSWLNIALTVIALYVIYRVAAVILPWLFNSVWNAESLQQCREIITGQAGEAATGACWAMVKARWHQFIFGFYPQDLYWRPLLTFVLMLVALAPVLFFGLPRKMLWFTLLFPFLGFWLLWGGSVWLPVSVLLGFGVIGLALALLSGRVGSAAALVFSLIAGLLYWVYLAGPVASTLQGVLPISIREVRSSDFGGFLLSFVIGVGAIAASLPLGILLALGRRSDMLIVKSISVGIIEFIRGVPLITVLFTASLLLAYFLPKNTTFDIILRVMILVTLFAAAYIAEVIRGGLAALPKGQYEAADALGLDYWQAQRLIIMPQALKISIPGIVSSFIGLFKDTTLVAFVGLLDPLVGVTRIVRADLDWKGIYWEPYLFVGAIFFIFCFGMSRYSMYLERKLKREHR